MPPKRCSTPRGVAYRLSDLGNPNVPCRVRRFLDGRPHPAVGPYVGLRSVRNRTVRGRQASLSPRRRRRRSSSGTGIDYSRRGRRRRSASQKSRPRGVSYSRQINRFRRGA